MRYKRLVPTNRVTVEPTCEPVTCDQIKDNAQITDYAGDDPFINEQLIPTARRFVEKLACRSLITQTRAQYHDYLPSEEFVLRYSPVQSISSITYKDYANATQTLSTSLYTLDASSIPARVRVAFEQTWPSVADVNKAVTVTYVAGYGATYSTVPIIYRRAIILLCTHWLNNRDAMGCADADLNDMLCNMLAIEGVTVEYA